MGKTKLPPAPLTHPMCLGPRVQASEAIRVPLDNYDHRDCRGQSSHTGQAGTSHDSRAFREAFSSNEPSPLSGYMALDQPGPALSPLNLTVGPSQRTSELENHVVPAHPESQHHYSWQLTAYSGTILCPKPNSVGPKDSSCSPCPWFELQTPQGWQNAGLIFSPFFQTQWPSGLCPISSSRK